MARERQGEHSSSFPSSFETVSPSVTGLPLVIPLSQSPGTGMTGVFYHAPLSSCSGKGPPPILFVPGVAPLGPTLILPGSPSWWNTLLERCPGTAPFYEWTSLGSAHSLRPYWSAEGKRSHRQACWSFLWSHF